MKKACTACGARDVPLGDYTLARGDGGAWRAKLCDDHARPVEELIAQWFDSRESVRIGPSETMDRRITTIEAIERMKQPRFRK